MRRSNRLSQLTQSTFRTVRTHNRWIAVVACVVFLAVSALPAWALDQISNAVLTNLNTMSNHSTCFNNTGNPDYLIDNIALIRQGQVMYAESNILNGWLGLYEATGNTNYLTNVARHLKTIFANRADVVGILDEARDCYCPGWPTDYYEPGNFHVMPHHTGLICTPAARWCYFVNRDPAIRNTYNSDLGQTNGAYAATLLDKIDESLMMFSQPYNGKDIEEHIEANGEIWYEDSFTTDCYNQGVTCPDDTAIPYNMAASMGEAFLNMWLATGDNKYRIRAEGIALRFKNTGLELWWGSMYLWPYSEEYGDVYESNQFELMLGKYNLPENASYGGLNMRFAANCYREGLNTFTALDMERLFNTYRDNCKYVSYTDPPGIAISFDILNRYHSIYDPESSDWARDRYLIRAIGLAWYDPAIRHVTKDYWDYHHRLEFIDYQTGNYEEPYTGQTNYAHWMGFWPGGAYLAATYFPIYTYKTNASIDLDTTDVNQGLSQPTAVPEDGDTQVATQGSRTCRRNVDPAGGDHYIYFCVDDDFAYQGSRLDVFVTVQYYDDTDTGTLHLCYDGSSSAHTVAVMGASFEGSDTWKQYTWHLTDAYFGNNENQGADFRIFRSSHDSIPFYLDQVGVWVEESPAPAQVVNPSIADGATNVPLGATVPFVKTLAWGAPARTVSYNVYLGTSNPPASQGSVTNPEYASTLHVNTTYYWRVDAINSHGTIPGRVWSFTTEQGPFDFDNDFDVDQADFGWLQACLSGSGTLYTFECQNADLDGDTDVDLDDWQILHGCMNGSGNPVIPGCDP